MRYAVKFAGETCDDYLSKPFIRALVAMGISTDDLHIAKNSNDEIEAIHFATDAALEVGELASTAWRRDDGEHARIILGMGDSDAPPLPVLPPGQAAIITAVAREFDESFHEASDRYDFNRHVAIGDIIGEGDDGGVWFTEFNQSDDPHAAVFVFRYEGDEKPSAFGVDLRHCCKWFFFADAGAFEAGRLYDAAAVWKIVYEAEGDEFAEAPGTAPDEEREIVYVG